MARIKYYNPETGKWEYADSSFTTSNESGGNADQSVSVFNGKTASFYGDSLTEVNYHYTKGYHSWVKDILGLASYNNYGKSGYKVSDVYSKVNSVTDTADIVFVMCGVNDQTFSVPLGVMGDNTTDTTYGALNLLCAKLKDKYPTSIVVFITPHYQTKYPHSSGVTSYEVSKAIREVCEKYAIPVYDNFVLSGIYSTNLSAFTTDNCHWNDTAHEMVGKNLAKFVTDSFRYIYGNTSGEGGDGSGDEGETTVSVTGVTLNAESGTLTEGESVTLDATVLPSNATNKKITWKSSNNSVSTVSNGVVSAISEGTATITATTEDGGFTDNYVLTVEAKETEIKVTIIGNSAQSATYENNTLEFGELNQTFAGVIFDGATEVSIPVTEIVNGTDSPTTAFGWFCARDGEVYHAFGMAGGDIETWDFDSTLRTASNNGSGTTFPNSGMATVIIEGSNVNLYFDNTLAYSTTGDAIGIICSKNKRKTYHLTVN